MTQTMTVYIANVTTKYGASCDCFLSESEAEKYICSIAEIEELNELIEAFGDNPLDGYKGVYSFDIKSKTLEVVPTILKGESKVGKEEEGEWYLNKYICPCGSQWEDEHSCMCNDRCPDCNKEIVPFESIELKEECVA